MIYSFKTGLTNHIRNTVTVADHGAPSYCFDCEIKVSTTEERRDADEAQGKERQDGP